MLPKHSPKIPTKPPTHSPMPPTQSPTAPPKSPKTPAKSPTQPPRQSPASPRSGKERLSKRSKSKTLSDPSASATGRLLMVAATSPNPPVAIPTIAIAPTPPTATLAMVDLLIFWPDFCFCLSSLCFSSEVWYTMRVVYAVVTPSRMLMLMRYCLSSWFCSSHTRDVSRSICCLTNIRCKGIKDDAVVCTTWLSTSPLGMTPRSVICGGKRPWNFPETMTGAPAKRSGTGKG
mmetsp:Transcript_1888/g.3834  ORF Transcript_1888/g.3834 Transcript_1888/m.3834 type:complete len:232 (-) Transcript_1888:208-903(-)